MTSRNAALFAVLCLASALLLMGLSWAARALWLARQARSVEAIIKTRKQAPITPKGVLSAMDRIVAVGLLGLGSALGRQLVGDEDRHLLDQCGVNDSRGQALFFLARLVLGTTLPVVGWALFAHGTLLSVFVTLFFGFGIGYMGPKWAMSRYAKRRRTRAADELPLLIDLLRLLQGVGLSVDQSLHIIEADFAPVLPVLVQELRLASSQYAMGRGREQSLKRFSTVFDNEDLGSVARLLVQVDRYGGAVQEPLKQFGMRIREQRKLDLREKVGQLTVKMTGVMVLTLLPALLIVTGGAGFLAVIRALSGMHA
jgi:tight adherence protein C